MNNKIDHFGIGAASLEVGISALQAQLGVETPRGGKHDMMSTHNCVMQAGDESFLEILAIDPDAPPPGRARWFSMDDPATIARLAVRPRTLCWIVGTDDLDAVVAASPVDLGEIVHFTRGDRSWRLTVPTDGHLPWSGLLPAFIEWSPGPHPSTAQRDLGVRLDKVQISHPDPASCRQVLDTLQVGHLADVTEGQAALSFHLMGPIGAAVVD